MTPILEEALKNLCGISGCMHSVEDLTEVIDTATGQTLLIQICEQCLDNIDHAE